MRSSVDDGPTRILNAFQRDARAALEGLLPVLHRPRAYPDAFVDGWGDLRGGHATSSTVVLMSPKAVRLPGSTKQLGRLRLEVSDGGEWTATVSVVAQPDELCAWPPAEETAWWRALRERIRVAILGYRAAKA